MIVDTLDKLESYAGLHANFAKVVEFVKNNNLADLAEGKHEIDGENSFALVSRAQGRAKEDALLEIHRNYIDIQVVLGGSDEMGWKALADLKKPQKDFDCENDFQLFEDNCDTWVKVLPEMFAIFFPSDAHAPLIGDGEIHKIVIKVKV